MTLANHSVAEIIRGFPNAPFHGSRLASCFSRIWSNELRASESMGWTRPLAKTGSLPNSVNANVLSWGARSVLKNHAAITPVKMIGNHFFICEQPPVLRVGLGLEFALRAVPLAAGRDSDQQRR